MIITLLNQEFFLLKWRDTSCIFTRLCPNYIKYNNIYINLPDLFLDIKYFLLKISEEKR